MKKILPPTIFLLAVLFQVIIHFVRPVVQILDFPWRWSGLGPLALGVWLNLSADHAFKAYSTTVKPFEVSQALITEGVFRFTRNPMYLGMTLILLGLGLLLGSATPLTVVLITAVLFDLLYISPEERLLRQTFGNAYLQYRTTVRRWI
jgi:protein-S-isoprenylcysteine O-methyltransferase Ste14